MKHHFHAALGRLQTHEVDDDITANNSDTKLRSVSIILLAMFLRFVEDNVHKLIDTSENTRNGSGTAQLYLNLLVHEVFEVGH